MVTMFFIYGTIIIANLITAWIVVNQKHAETEIILAKQRIEEITGSSEVSKEIPKGEKETVFDFLTKHTAPLTYSLCLFGLIKRALTRDNKEAIFR